MPYSSEIVSNQMGNRGATFGKTAAAYAAGRKSYPNEIFNLLETRISKDASILELGCGTGLATKQLYDKGFSNILATDIDPLMIETARSHCPQVSFRIVDAHALPFPDQHFESILAFGCFHWFCNPQALKEIKRVLKPGGILFVVNKQDTGSFREVFKSFLESLEERSILEPKALYQPEQILQTHHFAVSAHAVSAIELFTEKELLDYVRSISLWTSLSPEKQQSYAPFLSLFIESLVKGGIYERTIEVQCLIASQE